MKIPLRINWIQRGNMRCLILLLFFYCLNPARLFRLMKKIYASTVRRHFSRFSCCNFHQFSDYVFAMIFHYRSSYIHIERSRKLFKAHISALFLFLSFISSSIFRKRNSIFFSISIDICLKLCGRVW